MDVLNDIENNEIQSYLVTHKIENNNFYSFIFTDILIQGWKIHISCTINNYIEIMNLSLKYLIRNKINFKIIKNINLYFKNSRKTGDRTSFGKFITIYPNSEESFILIIEELYKLLKYYEGPYILSDKRYKDSKVLFYRYGSNVLRNKYDKKGNAIRIFEHNNKTYIDDPKPYFELPVSIKDPVDSGINEGISSYLLKKYEIIEAIKFSPIGGVYKALKLDNSNYYIIKEIYPYTGVYDKENDALSFAKKEIENSNKLLHFDFISKIYEYFYDWDNFYLVRTYIEGENFEDYSGKRNPIPFNAPVENVLDYCKDILNKIKIISNKINILYENGFALTDIGPDNIVINEDVYFIDLESLIEIKNVDNKQIINYTEGFWLKENNVIDNIKYNISSLIMYSLNKKNSIFNHLSENEILSPIIARYPFVKEILNAILEIKKDTTEISGIENIIRNIIYRLSINNYKNKTLENIEFMDFSNLIDNKIDYIDNKFLNENSIAYGQQGKILASIYVNASKFNKEDLILFENDFRTPSLFYGHSGLLYIYNLLKFDTYNLVEKIIENIDYTDLSISEGICGTGIALIHDYTITRNKKSLKVLEKIKKNIINNYTKNSIINNNISLDKGILGYSLFLTYYSYIFNDKNSKKYSKKYIDLVLRKIDEESKLNLLFNKVNYHKKEYYIENGIYGIIVVILEYITKFNYEGYNETLKKLLEESEKIYSLSPNFYFGSSGFLYTFYRVMKEYNENIINKINFDENINLFYFDIVNTFKNGEFLNTNINYNSYGYLGGKEGIITVLDLIKNDRKTNIFPFII